MDKPRTFLLIRAYGGASAFAFSIVGLREGPSVTRISDERGRISKVTRTK